MLTPEENDLLCRVEGAAPMGSLMRRHWIPVCLAEEVAEADGTPVHAKILGEDLVVFRDSDGNVGVLDEHCPHRRASLVMGRNEEGGLRCLYHGWKVDVKGNVLEMASEPASSGLCSRVKHTAYPTQEWGGFVWAYLGPADAMPAFEPPAFAPTRETRVSIVKVQVPCNWAQILEGAIDSAHSSSLHSTDMPPARVDGAKATATVWPRPSTDKARPRDNNYLQGRNAMKLGDFTGIRGIPMQDMAMWETMGRIADRGAERLGASDLAIVEFRRIMVEAVRRFAAGDPAIGTGEPRIAHASLRSFEGIVPKATDWRTLGTSLASRAAE